MAFDQTTATYGGQQYRLVPREDEDKKQSQYITYKGERYRLIPREDEALLKTPVPPPRFNAVRRRAEDKSKWTVPQYTGEGLDVAREKNLALYEDVSGVVKDIGSAVGDWWKTTPPGKTIELGKLAATGAMGRTQPIIEKELGGVEAGLTEATAKPVFPGATGTYGIGSGQITTGFEDFGKTLSEFANQTIVPPLEAVRALGGGMVGFPISMAATFLNKLGEAQTWEEALAFGEEYSQNMFSAWMPKTERGKKLTAAAFKPFEYIFQKPEDFLVKKFGNGDPEREAKIRLAWRSAILLTPIARAKFKGMKFDFTRPFKEAFKEAAKEMGVVKPKVTSEMATKYFHSGIDLREAVQEIIDPTGTLASEAKGLANDLRSPSKVFKASEAGRRLWDVGLEATLANLSWLHKEAVKYKAASKGIKKGSDLESGVFKTLDSKMPVAEILKGGIEKAKEYGITDKEFGAMQKDVAGSTRLRAFYVERMPAMLRQYGRTLVDETMENRLWNLTKKGKQPKRLKDAETGKMRSLNENETLLVDLYARRITDYIPHMFDRKTILGYITKELETISMEMTALEKQGLSIDSPAYIKLMQRQSKLRGTEKSIKEGPVNQPLMFDSLPTTLKNKYFLPRKGMGGYETSSMAAYESYVSGIAKKIFTEPAIKQMALHFKDLPIDQKNYAARYIRDFAGYTTPTEWASNMRSLQWMLKLGVNPRSALVNFTQQMNTIAEFGPTAAIRGYKNAITNKDNIRERYNNSGLRETAHQTFIGEEQKFPLNAMEKVRRAAGWMFEKVEDGNRFHEYSTGYFDAIRKGKSAGAANLAGIKAVGTGQFFYGKLDMPMMMRTTKGSGERALAPLTGLATQFWSFPVKQVELLVHWQKTNPKALARWIILAEGARHGLDSVGGLDLSNALGFGVEWGDLIEAVQAAAEGDATKTFHKARKGLQGGGLAPYGLGPAFGMLSDFGEVLTGETGLGEAAYRQLTPNVLQRGIQTGKALAEGKITEGEYAGKYPVRNMRGDLMYVESILQLGARVFIARPAVEKRDQRFVKDKTMDRRLKNKVIRDLADAIAMGDSDKANEIMSQFKTFPMNLKQSVAAAILRKTLTAKDRAELNKGLADYMFERAYLDRK